MRLKTFIDGCNKGEFSEWREETLSDLDFLDVGFQLDFFRQGMNERSN